MPRKALIHQIEARERRGRWFGALATLLSISLLLSGWVGLFAFLGANSAFGTFEEVADEWVPDTRSMELNLPDLSRVSRVYADSGEVLAELHDGRNSEPIPYSQVPEVMVNAILAAEDSEFFEHEGVDFSAIVSAAIDNFISDSTRGGSTITQQLVKNAFVGSEISIRRKVNEAFVSAEVERRFPKERILEYYLNSVYFGAGAYGVKTAAEEFFDKPLSDISLHEAATLAVLVRNPSLYNPRIRPEHTLERRNDVISEMLDEGWIDESQATGATSQPLGVVDTPPQRGQADHVVAQVRRQLLHSDEFAFLGDTAEDRKRAIFGCPADDVECEGGGGLQIYTTIDLKLQKEANRVLNEWLPAPPYEENVAACAEIFPDFEENEDYYQAYAETHSCRPTGAIAMVDNGTGAVRVMASGLDFEFSQFDLAVQGRRNPGSAFKAIGLAAALDQGLTLGHRWAGTSPLEVECEFICSPNGTNIWTVSNASGSSTGVITLEEATYRSVNTVYAQVSRDTGPENVVDMARRMGITEASLEPVLSIVLGASAVSPLEMASAFSNFATNGAHADDYIVDRIVDHEGDTIYQKELEVTQVADPALFAAARRPLLKVPTSSGTASRAAIDHPAGGKTGTHQSYLDAWYVGFTPEFSTAVWVGYEAEQIPLEDVTIGGQAYSRVFGGTVPAPIWGEFMTIVTENLPESQFPADPSNIEQYLKPPPTTVPSVVGLSRGAAIEKLRVGAKLNVSAKAIPSLEPEGIVVRQSIGAGATVPQGTTVTIWVSNGQAPVGALPDFVGMTVEEAKAAAAEFTKQTNVALELVTEEVPVKDPNRVGQVVGTNPPAGAEITASATVVLQVGVPAPEDNGGGGGGGGGDGGDGGGGGGGDGGGGDDD
jgi:membrane peptidoglycan carboxypeptidase